VGKYCAHGARRIENSNAWTGLWSLNHRRWLGSGQVTL